MFWGRTSEGSTVPTAGNQAGLGFYTRESDSLVDPRCGVSVGWRRGNWGRWMFDGEAGEEREGEMQIGSCGEGIETV